ncbi:MAG: hypothetical protein J5791_04890 [Fibrobacter sp.]|nr:hypothetical protein [Fibrobacter sp.]
MPKRTALLLLAACAAASAGDIAVSLPSSENLGEKISFLKDLRENSKLDPTQQKDFNDLWKQANNVASMNNRCGSILLNDIPDEACQHFYEVELPAFEAKFFELTGEFKLNAVKASNTLSDKRAMIEACAAAISPEAYQVSNIMTIMGEVSPEPLDDGMAMIKYNLTLAINKAKREAIEGQLTKWYEACSEGIMSQDDYSPLFVQRIKKQVSSGGNYIDILGDKIVVVQAKQERFSYYVNDRFLFGKSILAGAKLLSIDKAGAIRFINTSGIQWKDYAIFNEAEIQKKGFNGRMLWGDRTAPLRTPRVFKSGRIFKSVTIGKQEWAAMDLGTGDWRHALQTCPVGWHLPTNDDWIELGNFVKDNSYGAPIPVMLKTSRGWSSPGVDLYGFSAKPGKYREQQQQQSQNTKVCAKYWSTNNVNQMVANYWELCDDKLRLADADMRNSYSIRCIQDGNFSFKK